MKLRSVLTVGALMIPAVVAIPAAASAVTTPPGGGGCTMSVTGANGYESFTAHISNTCGYQVRAKVECVNDLTNNLDYKYGPSTTAVTATSKASCGFDQQVTQYGWEYNAGGGWIIGWFRDAD
jgi:hypothetical protein